MEASVMKAEFSFRKIFLFVVAFTSYLVGDSLAAPSNEEVNKSNNPLTPALGLNLQDYYTGSYFGLPDSSDSNATLLRGVVPHKLFDLPQIMRITAPLQTSPDVPGGSVTGLGDVSIFDIFLTNLSGVEVGIGPQLVFPTATDNKLGAGKWQAGISSTVIAPEEWGLIGALIIYQHSIMGDDDRLTQNLLQGQPFFIYNLPAGFFFRSTAIWNFDLEHGDYFIPLGAGFGKAFKTDSGTLINIFGEPQWTLFHEGVSPNFQLFVGLNLQFPIGGN